MASMACLKCRLTRSSTRRWQAYSALLPAAARGGGTTEWSPYWCRVDWRTTKPVRVSSTQFTQLRTACWIRSGPYVPLLRVIQASQSEICQLDLTPAGRHKLTLIRWYDMKLQWKFVHNDLSEGDNPYLRVLIPYLSPYRADYDISCIPK